MLNDFDYGAELSEEEIAVRLWPTEGTKVALVDADLIPYTICYAVDTTMELRANYRVQSGECATLSDTPEFEELVEKMCQTHSKWIKDAGCDAAIPYMTDSESNFRINVAFSRPYKGQRKKQKPAFFYELKAFFIEHMGAILSDGEEADDLIAIEATRRNKLLEEQGIELGSPTHKEFADYVIVSSDKDSRITCGPHYDPYHKRLSFGTVIGELEPVWKDDKVKDIKGYGIKFFYAQLLMGDSVDNYTGIPRYRLSDIMLNIAHLKTEKELYYAVLGEYKKKYGEGTWVDNYRGTEKYRKDYLQDFGKEPPEFSSWKGRKRFCTPYEMMLEQARLAHMQTYKGEIWRAKATCPLGSEVQEWHL